MRRCPGNSIILSLFTLLVVSARFTCYADEPATAEQLLTDGHSALSQGLVDKAVQYYQQGIEALAKEGKPSLEMELGLHINLGTAYSMLSEEERAVASYSKAIQLFQDAEGSNNALNSDGEDLSQLTAQAAFFLGMVYQDMDQAVNAVKAYQQAVLLDSGHWSAVANLGSLLHDVFGDHENALDAYNMAYELLTNTDSEPTDPPEESDFYAILSDLQYRIGLCISHDPNRRCALSDSPDTAVDCKEMAAHAFSLALEYNPENENARHMLASTTADASMKRASNTYVKSLFDDYASNFEHSLVEELGYNGYERLRRAFDRAFETPPSFSKAVDAGCGTGLVGEQFRNVTETMIGVDLSEAILQEAEKARPKLYDELVAGDLTEVFRSRKPIDLITAGDSYIYFGDLDPLFASMEAGLAIGGYAAFTLENVDVESEKVLSESKPDWRWQLTASGRFAHRKEYVLATGQMHSLRLVRYEALNDFRYEKGVGVRGHIFVMQRIEDSRDEL